MGHQGFVDRLSNLKKVSLKEQQIRRRCWTVAFNILHCTVDKV